MKPPKVSETVNLPRRFSGAEVIRVIEQVIGDSRGDPCKPTLFKTQCDKLGFAIRIGQASLYRYQHLLIVPSAKSSWFCADYFNIGDTYASVEVVSQCVLSKKPFDVSFGETDIEKAVRDFAEKLRDRFLV